MWLLCTRAQHTPHCFEASSQSPCRPQVLGRKKTELGKKVESLLAKAWGKWVDAQQRRLAQELSGSWVVYLECGLSTLRGAVHENMTASKQNKQNKKHLCRWRKGDIKRFFQGSRYKLRIPPNRSSSTVWAYLRNQQRWWTKHKCLLHYEVQGWRQKRPTWSYANRCMSPDTASYFCLCLSPELPEQHSGRLCSAMITPNTGTCQMTLMSSFKVTSPFSPLICFVFVLGQDTGIFR